MNAIRRCKPLLGTHVEVFIKGLYSDKVLIDIGNKIYKEISIIQNIMSYHDDNSELTYINNNAYYHECIISQEMSYIINHCLDLSKLTNGLYDISIAGSLIDNDFLPNRAHNLDRSASYKDIVVKDNRIKFSKMLQIDLGGVAKGYALDKALSAFNRGDINGVDVIINAGGDIIMSNWSGKIANIKVKINNRFELIPVEMKNAAIATSASYYFDNNKNPIISPLTRKMIKDKRVVSVFSPSCMIADSLTKVAFLDYNNCKKIFNKYDSDLTLHDESDFSGKNQNIFKEN